MARTHDRIRGFLLAVIAALSIALMTACEHTARGLKQDPSEAEAGTRERADARELVRDPANAAAQAARTVGALTADAGEEVAERASALKENVDVKAALMADASVDATRIDVHVSAWSRTITLNGSVPTARERGKAEAITRARAQGYKVVNNIALHRRD